MAGAPEEEYAEADGLGELQEREDQLRQAAERAQRPPDQRTRGLRRRGANVPLGGIRGRLGIRQEGSAEPPS